MTIRIGLLLTCTVVVELCVLRRLRFDAVVVAIVLAGTCLYANYLSYTSVSERNYDGPAHIEYVQSLASTLHVPDVFACAACGHPPLYYAIAAVWSKAMHLGGWIPLELGLEWLSLLLFFAFIVFALLIFRSCTSQTKTLRLAAALVVFWPSSVINSVRVHNDALASPLMLAAMYFTAEWDKHGRGKDFAAALVVSALALSTKASGYAVAAALLFFTVLRLGATEQRARSFKQLISAALVLGTTALLLITLRTSRYPRTGCQLILGSACNGRYVLPLPDSPSRFLSFQLHDFVDRLAILPEDPVLNRLAKSSLFGVMPLGEPFTDARHELLGHWMSWGLLALLAVCVVGVPSLGRASLRQHRAYLGSVAIMALFLLAFRIRAPNEFHEDFRHVFAALAPFCLAYAAVVVRVRRYSKLLHHAGVGLALLMIALSIAFFARIPDGSSSLGLLRLGACASPRALVRKSTGATLSNQPANDDDIDDLQALPGAGRRQRGGGTAVRLCLQRGCGA